MFKISFTNNVTVSLETSNPNESTRQQWSGEPSFVEMMRFSLSGVSGAFGHTFDNDFATPIDLHHAVFNNLKGYLPAVVEGEDIVKEYDTGLGVNAIT